MSEALLKNQQLASDVPRPNLLQNGGFEQWPFGTTGLVSPGPGPSNWYNGGFLTVVRDSVNADVAQGGTYCVAATSTTPGAELQHYFSDPTNRGLGPLESGLIGRIHTFSMRIKTAVANGCRLCVYDSVSGRTLFSPYHNGDGTWQTISMQYTAPAGATSIIPMARFDVNGIYYLDNASMVPGNVVSNYHPFSGMPDALPNGRLASDVARAILATNGGFEIWQRGTGPFTANSVMTADRWYNSYGGSSTVSVSQIASTVGSVGKSVQLTYVHGGGGAYSQFLNRVEDTNGQFANKTVTFSATVKSSVAGTVFIRLQGYALATSKNSPYNVGTGSERLSVTLTLPAGENNGLYLIVQNDVASCTVEVNDVTLVVGPIAGDYAPLHPAEDLARCLRYYQRFDASSNSSMVFGSGLTYTTTNGIHLVPVLVKFSGAPTVTVSAPGNFAATGSGLGQLVCTGLVAYAAGPDHLSMNSTFTGGIADRPSLLMANASAGAAILLESNP